MKQSRMEQLADGIFAIVMTLLVFEIRVPYIAGLVTGKDLALLISQNITAFLSFLLSFILLFTYWRSHHFIASVYTKSIDIAMTNINALFLFLVALVPFSASVLGRYSDNHFAIFLFAIHIIFIGLSLYWMRRYAEKSAHIETSEVTKIEANHSYVRILFPVFSAMLAIVVSFFNIQLSLFLFTIGILFNLSRRSTKLIFRFIHLFNKKIEG